MSAHRSALARRDVLKGAGLLVGFSLAGALPPRRAAAAVSARPDPNTLDAWIAIRPDSSAVLLLGKVELGQGNSTTMLQLAGEELDLGMDQLFAARVDSFVSPNQGATVSSSSIAKAGPQIRKAAAEARQALLRLASQRLDVPAAQLSVHRGVVSAAEGTGKSVSYGDLIGGKRFDVAFTGTAPLKHAADYRLVGTSVPRLDIPAKAAGSYEFMQNARLPDMLHGRVVRPRGQGAYASVPRLVRIDEASIAGLPDVRIVRRGNFVGVVAPREWDAVQAADRLAVEWAREPRLAGTDGVFDRMRASPTTDMVVTAKGDTATAFATTAHTVSGTFRGPYQGHAPFGPSCALADVRADSALVMCSSQDVFAVRDCLAALLRLPDSRVQVQYYPGAGCYGHSCMDDAAEAAAVMSQAVGRPVRVQFMRWDELGWDNYGPAHLGEIHAAADANGKLVAYEYHAWQHGWMTVESTEQMAAGTKVEEITPASGIGSIFVNPVNAGSMYDIPNKRIVNHHVAGPEGYMKAANLRSPLDISVSFASEQAIDGLAHSVGTDPVAFRRANVSDPRWRGVLDAVAEASGWTPRTERPAAGDVVKGRGIALGTHRETRGAAFAEVEVNRRTGAVVATRMVGAIDAGQVVNPDIVESQVMGMLVQAASRMLKEEVTFTDTAVTSLDWDSYPVLRFGECPDTKVIVLQRMDVASSGAGEEVLAAGAAAIANAFFDATGVRMTEYPLSPPRVVAALGGKPGAAG